MSHAEAAFPVEVEAEPIQDRSAWGRGVLALYDFVTSTAGRRTTDVTRLSFPFQVVIGICCAVLAGASAYWAGTSAGRSELAAVRSDVRDIKTSLDGVTKQQGIEIEQLRRDYDGLKAQQELQRVRFEETRNTLAEIRGFMSGMKGAPK